MMTETALSPPIPVNVEETGLPEALIQELILKALCLKKELMGLELAAHLGLPFGVTEGLLEDLKRQRLVYVLRSSDLGSVSAAYALTEAGTHVASQHLATSRYAGKAPVPARQYDVWVRRQQRKRGWLSGSTLEQGLSHIVTRPQMLKRLGPALNSAKSFMIYGNPGNGKTLLAESIHNLIADAVYIPYALECQGKIIQLFDPQFHDPVSRERERFESLTHTRDHDERWCHIRRPLVISGGELTPEFLDLSYSETLGYYTAPLQLKANNGFYLVDDLGRQRVSPKDILNRWIVPLEQGLDYLHFRDGSNLRVVFDTFLIFSTNLDPERISDEAFLRRIQYKMLMGDPDAGEYREIFARNCRAMDLAYDEELVEKFIERHYRAPGRGMRRCHPRDILAHAINLIEFHDLAYVLTDEILDEAFESCLMANESANR